MFRGLPCSAFRNAVLMAVLRGLYGMLEIELMLTVCQAKRYSTRTGKVLLILIVPAVLLLKLL